MMKTKTITARLCRFYKGGTPTKRTPLMMAVAFGPTSCSSGHVPKSELLHSPEAQYGFVPKHSHHGGKNIALRAEKPFSARLRLNESITMLASVIPSGSKLERSSMRSFFSEAVFFASRNTGCTSAELKPAWLCIRFSLFLPLKMSYVAKQCVVMSWLVRELAHRHKAMTAAQKLGELRHRQRGI